jgi:hypothetical protein
MAKGYRCTVVLLEKSLEILKRIAEQKNGTLADAMRQCIADAGFLEKLRERGETILIDRGWGPFQRLIFR